MDKKTQKVCDSLYVLAICFSSHVVRFQQINRLNVSLFTPALLFSKVAFSLSPGKFSHHINIFSRVCTRWEPSGRFGWDEHA